MGMAGRQAGEQQPEGGDLMRFLTLSNPEIRNLVRISRQEYTIKNTEYLRLTQEGEGRESMSIKNRESVRSVGGTPVGQIHGPDAIGQIWHCGYWNQNYTILDAGEKEFKAQLGWQWVKVRWQDGRTTTHSTAVSKGDYQLSNSGGQK